MSFLLFTVFAILFSLFKMSFNNKKKRRFMDYYIFKPFIYEKVASRGEVVPLPRSGHRIVANDSCLYAFGGYNPANDERANMHSYPLFQELWRFNFATRRWKKHNGEDTFPKELASNAVLRQGNLLMVYGGTGAPFGRRCSNKLYIGRLNDDENGMCLMTTTGQPPIPLYGQAMVYYNGYLYTVGGTTGFEYNCDIHRLNMKTLVWEEVYICQGRSDYEPTGRYRHEVAFDGRFIYVLGGGTVEQACDFVVIPTFDIETNRWHRRMSKRDPRAVDDTTGIPAPRRCHGAIQMDTPTGIHVFIVGGYDGEDVFNDLWKLDLSTLQWTRIETCILPRPTYFHSVTATPAGKLYVFGGNYAGEYVSRNNEVYTAWLCVPKLSEISWEAVLKYSPGIVDVKRELLIDAGLPRKFLQRLE